MPERNHGRFVVSSWLGAGRGEHLDDRPVGAAPAVPAAPQIVTFDALMPATMAERCEQSGVKKASMDAVTLLVLSVMAGAFISFGAIVATTVSAGGVSISTAAASQSCSPDWHFRSV
jgi:hypothetical protein